MYDWNKEKAFMLRMLESSYDKKGVHEFLTHSELTFEPVIHRVGGQPTLYISVDPYIFLKNHHLAPHFGNDILKLFHQVAGLERFPAVRVTPDLEKFHILQNDIIPVVTPWQEINSLQEGLIKSMRMANDTIAYQNVGNSARTIMLKLASTVFDEKRHTATVDLSEAKFKNRLHTYIKTELATKQQDELRQYTEAIISATEKGIDLMNKVTHDTKTDGFYAETCAISVVTSIHLIKLIHEMTRP